LITSANSLAGRAITKISVRGKRTPRGFKEDNSKWEPEVDEETTIYKYVAP
jgi:hypothetical protein